MYMPVYDEDFFVVDLSVTIVVAFICLSAVTGLLGLDLDKTETPRDAIELLGATRPIRGG